MDEIYQRSCLHLWITLSLLNEIGILIARFKAPIVSIPTVQFVLKSEQKWQCYSSI